jgi:transcriptional regulator EpsA
LDQLVILSKLEQEYLLRVIEAALHVRDLRGFFLWSQGQLQALLPHQVLVGMQFGPADELLRLECLHATVMDEAALGRLCALDGGLALQLARQGQRQPLMADTSEQAGGPLAPLRAALHADGHENFIVRGTGRLPGGSSSFLLLGMPMKPGPRTAYFLELLLPYLHMALLRLSQQDAAVDARAEHEAILRPLSAREIEILGWLRQGKSNYEVGRILGISALTVKNHLQRIYKTLGVSNRTHALARCMSLNLLEAPDGRRK